MSKKLTNPQKLAKLQKLTNLNPQYSKNTIIFVNKAMDAGKPNPRYGKLFAITEDVETEIDIKTAEFYLARLRVQIRSTKRQKDSKGNDRAKYWCREGDDTTFLQIHDIEENIVAEGSYQDLKEKYDLKFYHAAYVYYNGNVYRWVISTAHRDTWFPLSNALGKNPAQTFKIAGMKENTDGAFPYYTLNFEIAGEFDYDKAIEISNQVAKELNEYYINISKAKEKAPKEIEEPVQETNESEALLDDLPF